MSLKEIIEKKYLHHGDYTLSSGAKSDKYFDIKSLMGDYKLLDEVAMELLVMVIDDVDFKSLGGLELGGVPLVTQMLTYAKNYDKSICFIRKQQRIHGLKKMIEGKPKNPILLVDDVISSGKTIDAAIKTLYADPYGYVPCGILCVINRSNLEGVIIKDPNYNETRQIPIYSLFKESDFE